ncbi:hypothetical protein D3C72_1478470 [compost metagenome]
MSLFIHFFWHFLLGPKYEASLPIIYILCLAQALFGSYMTMGIVIDYYKYNKLKSIIIWMCAIGCLSSSILLLPIFKIYAPAIGSGISFLILSITTFYYARKIMVKYNVS